MINKQPETSGPFEGCIVMTFEDTKQLLDEVEQKLAEREGLHGNNIHEQLIALDKAGKLVEDNLVADWYDALAWHNDWHRNADDNATKTT